MASGYVAATNIVHGKDDGESVTKDAGEKVTESEFGKDAFEALKANGAIVREGSREYHEAFGYPPDEAPEAQTAPTGGGE